MEVTTQLTMRDELDRKTTEGLSCLNRRLREKEITPPMYIEATRALWEVTCGIVSHHISEKISAFNTAVSKKVSHD